MLNGKPKSKYPCRWSCTFEISLVGKRCSSYFGFSYSMQNIHIHVNINAKFSFKEYYCFIVYNQLSLHVGISYMFNIWSYRTCMHCCLHRVTSASRQTRIQLFLERMMELSDPLLELGYIVPAMSIRNAMLLRLLLFAADFAADGGAKAKCLRLCIKMFALTKCQRLQYASYDMRAHTLCGWGVVIGGFLGAATLHWNDCIAH